MNKVKLAMHVITQNNQDKLLRLLENTQEIFDVIRICDGGSTDHTIEICEMFGCKVIKRLWEDDMSAQHNALLRIAKLGEWIFVMDDDEEPSPQLKWKLREYAEKSNKGKKYRLVKIPSIMFINNVADWTVPGLMRAIENNEQKDRFTKMNLFYNDDNIYYEGTSHYGLAWECIKDWPVRDMVPEPYFHYKKPIDIVQCNIQQAFINPKMQGISPSDGHKWAQMMTSHNIRNSHAMLRMLRIGDATPEMKQWMIDRRHPGLGSVSDFFEYYFLYHNPFQLLDFPEVMVKLYSHDHRDPALIRHLKDLGGYRSYTVDVIQDQGIIDWTEHWLPIAHLDMHPKLQELLNTNQILIKVSGSNEYDLDPFSEANKQDIDKDIAIKGC